MPTECISELNTTNRAFPCRPGLKGRSTYALCIQKCTSEGTGVTGAGVHITQKQVSKLNPNPLNLQLTSTDFSTLNPKP